MILTSNVGSEMLRRAEIGFGSEEVKTKDQSAKDFEKKVYEKLKDAFRPEFLNRLDETIIFTSLSPKDIQEIAMNQIKKSIKLLSEQNVTLKVTPQAVEKLADDGYNPEYGARPLRRLVQREIDNRLSEMIIKSEIKDGDTVTIDLDKKEITVEVDKPAKVKSK